MTENRAGRVVTFYSFKGGTGRTMALANVAWILAANGKRVLVADWDLESPGLHRFFSPFLDVEAISGTDGIINLIRDYEWETTRDIERPDRWYEEFARVERHAFSLRWDFPGEGSLDFLSAGRQNRDYAVTVGGLDWETFYNRLGGAQFFEALRADMKRNYDYTLIDSRTGLSDVADICTLHLPDTLVDCFTLSDQGIDGAQQVARYVRDRYRRRDIRILPVPMRVDQGEKEKADAGRALAMRRFADLPTGMGDEERKRYWSAVEVPYRPFYAYEETLATFGDEPGSPTSLLAAFERLTTFVTEGEITGLPAIDEAIRLRGKERFKRRADSSDEEIVLRYAPEDQAWAEWVDWILASAGIRVTDPLVNGETAMLAPAGSRTLTIVSPAYAGAAAGLPPRDPPGSRPPLALYVADLRPLPEFPVEATAYVSGLEAAAAAERLLHLVGRPGPTADGPLARGPRFPGDEPAIFKAPVRNARFTGRDDNLRHLRAQLRAGGSAVVLPVTLQGMGGVGKTQLALEYVHRFKSAYDLVWWVDADPPQFIDTSLTDLGNRLGVEAEPTVPDTTRSLLRALGRGDPYERWLLIFDNAEEPDQVERFVPQGSGHVLITSRNPTWGDRAQPVAVNVFTRQESIAHLRQRVGTIGEEAANEVAEALGDLPIAVAAAGAWLAETGTPVGDYLRQIERHGPSHLSVEATWDLSLNRLRSQSPAAYRLLQLCSVLSPEIALDLAYSDELAAALIPIDPSVAERLMRGALVQQINRLALLKLDVQGGQIQVHRLLQKVVRDRMSEEDVAAARHQVHLVLASSRPRGEVDDPATWRTFQILWPHLAVSDAAHCADEAVRQLLIDRVRYIWRRGGLEQGEQVAREIDEIWSGMLARAGDDQDHARALRRQLLHLRFTLANILRQQGRYHEARDLDEAVLAGQRELLGAQHPHTLMTNGGLAADLRALGFYQRSLEMEKLTVASWMELFGEDHPRTLSALNNLATAYRAAGDFRAARARDEDTFERRRIVLGPTNPYTLDSASNLGRDLREAGEYEKSVSLLRNVLEALVESLGTEAEATLNGQVNLAASLRAAGRPDEAKPLLESAYDQMDRRFGPVGQDTLACRLSRSSNLLALGDVTRARREVEAVARAYADSLGEEHPHTLVCLSNSSAVSRAAGERGLARQLAERAAETLRRTLGPEHPFALAAGMNHAVCLIEDGDPDQGRALLQETLTGLTATVGVDHPDTLRCRANLELALRAAGQPVPSVDVIGVVDRLAQAVGTDHPTVRALRELRYVHRVLDPHPY